MEQDRFEQLVAQALDQLPGEIQSLLYNVSVIVQLHPTPEQLHKVGIQQGHILLGLYEGIPRTRRASNYSLVLPDKITLFQYSIERICRTEEDIARQIQHTVIHELAHHFGISDDHLREIGAY